MRASKWLLVAGVALGLSACGRNPINLQEALPREGWRTYHDDVRGVTCWFFQHPLYLNQHFGAGCVPDSQWKR